MKSAFSIAAVICALVIAGESAAQRKTDFSFSPYVSKGFGYTKWVMEEYGDLGGGTLGTVKSELEYPLNALYGGLTLKFGSAPSAWKSWSVSLSLGTNFNDPSGIMKDHDWITVPGVIDEKISYTESSVEMSSLAGALEWTRTLTRGRTAQFGLFGGIRYQHIDQELYDLWGWQLNDDLARVYFDVFQDTLVGTYKITYTMPHFGFFTGVTLHPAATATLRSGFMIAIVSDEDDHVLRNRKATASGSGYGFLGGVSIRFAPAGPTRPMRPFLELDGELIYVNASPRQTIEWYGDDPITDYDDTGESAVVSHDITSMQGYITARIGLTF